ncbi:hypothetical protein RDABS01_032990 [Bienertia sinuspersici]
MSQRWRTFCWKLAHDALPTRDNLVKRKIKTNPTCVFCGNKESLDHLFLDCEITKRIWSSSPLGLKISACPSPSTPSWFKNMFIYLHKISDNHKQLWPILVATMWAIWIHKNNIIFRKEKGFRESIGIVAINPQNLTNERKLTSWSWGDTI